MLYPTAKAWRDAPEKRVMLFGMSGLGKTHLASLLRDAGSWFHYSVDYRIGTRYMGELIADNAKAEAMKVPFLAELLRTDSIYIGSNITFDNLAPLSTYLGKPGDPARGGLAFTEYCRRQDQHRVAEIGALTDAPYFIDRARALYGYPHFACDTGGSICEVVDPFDPADPVLTTLSAAMLPVWIEGTEAHRQDLICRFDSAPKPMYYGPDFLTACWNEYLLDNKVKEGDVDPNAFVRWTYARALAHRQPLYQAIARWGVTVQAEAVARVADAAGFDALIAQAIDRSGDRASLEMRG